MILSLANSEVEMGIFFHNFDARVVDSRRRGEEKYLNIYHEILKFNVK